ncbi:hypothetical protein GCM10010260_30940 [Streptomyces filipinensis]|uniref:Uncharacterized protein n=1 Tax=Streptomyces filipinensis TaxID=66887 RepID=A0A918IA73_9ACTN|nr:hypothetical protein [Streptomyces filipinensis]GGU93695.1 hypothetical protein GCM10010260_30940 [Streptomyces filipinensis]
MLRRYHRGNDPSDDEGEQQTSEDEQTDGPQASGCWRGADEDVDSALLTAVYPVDEDGDVRAALADATCAQIEYQLAAGADGTGAAGRWKSVSIGPISLSGRGRRAWATAGVDLALRAERALRRSVLPEVVDDV